MFLRYMTVLLLFGSASNYGVDAGAEEASVDPYHILMMWRSRDSLPREYTALSEKLHGGFMDFWQDGEDALVTSLPARAILYARVRKLSQETSPNQQKLTYLANETIRHHATLLSTYEKLSKRSSNQDALRISSAIRKAFPIIEVHREVVKRRKQFESQ